VFDEIPTNAVVFCLDYKLILNMKMQIKVMMEMAGTTETSCFNPEDCLVLVSVEIGPEYENGGNRFDFNVVTHAYLRRASESAWGRALLIVNKFEWVEIEKKIEDLISQNSVKTWNDGIKFLSLYMNWEYAGMVNSKGGILVPASKPNELDKAFPKS